MKTPEEIFNQFIAELESYFKLSTRFKMALRQVVHWTYFKKEVSIQHFEQIPDQLWFLVTGFAKESTMRADFSTWVTWFWFANDFLFTEPGLFSLSPADSQIQVVDDACLIHISFSDCIKLREEFPDEAAKLIKLIRAKVARRRKAHQVLIASNKLQARYSWLFQTHSELMIVARHKDILEFLGSTDDSFRSFQ